MIVQQVNGERVVLLGWSRAILMQLAHPLIAAGVLRHSTFRGGVREAAVRLHHTVSAMLALTFDDGARHQAAVDRIRAIHRTVHGTLAADVGTFQAGTPYSAEDPALLLWVHATLVDSTAGIYRRVVAPLSGGELDALCASALPLLDELGGDARSAPHTWDALQTYLDRVLRSGTLATTAEARELGLAVLSPRAAGVPLPFTGVQREITLGLAPDVVRQLYGFTWDAARQRRLERTLAAVRLARRLTPRRLARWPAAR